MGIIIKPIVTEKLTVQGEKLNRYGFIVDREANKLQIKAEVEQIYNVTVADVNTVNYHGKRKSRYTKAGTRKVLVVLPENSSNIYLSSRNLPEVKVITVDEINTYAIMNSNSMVLVDGVQDILESRIRR